MRMMLKKKEDQVTINGITECRACGYDRLQPILSLGNQYVTNFIDSKKDQEKTSPIPLKLVLCEDCKLLQLEHNTPPQLTWNEQYWYKSGISSTIKADLKDIVTKAQQIKNINKGDIVIDIGCNDGTLLDFYRNPIKKVGFEPSKNVAKEAIAKGHHVISDFFNANNFKNQFRDKKAKIITAISMFYDLDEPNKFLEDIVSCLDKEGLFVIQQNYLAKMLEQNAFDNICHEHREYYSLTSLESLLRKHKLEVFDVEKNDINGGSIRTYIKFQDNDNLKGFEGANNRMISTLYNEKEMRLDTLKPYQEFASRINSIKKGLRTFLKQEKKKDKEIWIYGASTRGNVALQYFELGTNLITGIADMNSDKWGKKTIGSLIPITSPEEMRKAKPDYLLINTWHFFDEIKKQEKDYQNNGGKFIVALPELRMI